MLSAGGVDEVDRPRIVSAASSPPSSSSSPPSSSSPGSVFSSSSSLAALLVWLLSLSVGPSSRSFLLRAGLTGFHRGRRGIASEPKASPAAESWHGLCNNDMLCPGEPASQNITRLCDAVIDRVLKLRGVILIEYLDIYIDEEEPLRAYSALTL
jgi:hypothetical protein